MNASLPSGLPSTHPSAAVRTGSSLDISSPHLESDPQTNALHAFVHQTLEDAGNNSVLALALDFASYIYETVQKTKRLGTVYTDLSLQTKAQQLHRAGIHPYDIVAIEDYSFGLAYNPERPHLFRTPHGFERDTPTAEYFLGKRPLDQRYDCHIVDR